MSDIRAASGTKARNKPPVEHQFKKGQSGNPAGRPPGIPNLTTRIQSILEGKTPLPEAVKAAIVTAAGEDKNALDALIMAGLLQGLKGDKAWAQLLWEHGYGKPVASVALVDPEDPTKPATFTLKIDNS